MPHATTAATAAETDRQVRRLYHLAYRIHRIANLLANPQATGDGVAYATTRIPRALSAARRLLTLPGVAEHDETPYALSFLTAAERQLNAPPTTLLRIAAAARTAAAHADAADDDLRVVVFRDIEERCRYLVNTAMPEPALGRRGLTTRDRAASDTLQQWAAQWGLTQPADTPNPTASAPPRTEPVPTVPAELSRQATDRAAARARCAAGIRCTEPDCLTYGALKVTFLPSAWLCTTCIPAVNKRLAANGYAPDAVQPDPAGTPKSARYFVTLYNAIGKGSRSVQCSSPQRAQFIAETERPFNNTGYTICVSAPPRN
ncbi:hypothetical protein ACH419_36460 [Streptomyces bobili]|uniref:hypothetical protein n=1 Tax=Streptomyces bobili TaxID=67280 RepID=UPI0037BB07FB